MSVTLHENIMVLEGYLNNVLNSLTNFNANNKFRDNISRINYNIDKFERLRQKLLEENNREELRRASQGLNEKVKQILLFYDNIIEQNENEQKKIKSELKDLINKKKLNNYL